MNTNSSDSAPMSNPPAAEPVLHLGMTSGARHLAVSVFLVDQEHLLRANDLKAKAANGMKGVSTGIGFLGSPQWAIGGAMAIGLLEGLASSAAAKTALSDLRDATRALEQARAAGIFVAVADVENIEVPEPAMWRGSTGSPAKANLKFYAHDGGPFLAIRTVEGAELHVAWANVEEFRAPPLQPQTRETKSAKDDEDLMRQLGISRNGEQYVYETYRYDKLADAIAYAQKQRQ